MSGLSRPAMSAEESEYDRVVIGAGIIGSCAAYQLLKAGHRSVLLLDQFPLPHSRGSSHGQSRVIRTAYRDPVQGEMARRTRTLWTDLERRAGQTLCKDCPMLVVSRASERTLFDAYLGCLEERQRTVYTGSQLSSLLPAARFPADSVGCVDNTAGLLHADKCLQAVQRLLLAAGGVVRDAAAVTSITPRPGSGGRLLQLAGPHGLVCTCRGLVVCAGAWAGRLLAPLGLPLDRLLQPMKVAVTYWRLRPGASAPLCGVDFGSARDNSQLFYWLPCLEYPGLVKLCYHMGAPCDPDRRDQVSVEDLVRQTSDYVARYFPGLEPQPAIVETCMYTASADERCILDVHPKYPNIVFAAGMSGEGFKMGPVFGEVLQRLVDGQQNDFDLSMFSIQRFDRAAKRSQASL